MTGAIFIKLRGLGGSKGEEESVRVSEGVVGGRSKGGNRGRVITCVFMLRINCGSRFVIVGGEACDHISNHKSPKDGLAGDNIFQPVRRFKVRHRLWVDSWCIVLQGYGRGGD